MRRIVKTTGILVLVAGCASIVSGTSQQITIDSNPKEANCTLTREGRVIGNVHTPSGLVIKKTKHDIDIVCGKEGYQRATATLTSDVESTTFGNLLIGGAVGWAIDSATGADNKYDDIITVTLVPQIASGGKGQTAASGITTSTAKKPQPGSMGSAKAVEAGPIEPGGPAVIAPPGPPASAPTAGGPTSISSTKAAVVDQPKPTESAKAAPRPNPVTPMAVPTPTTPAPIVAPPPIVVANPQPALTGTWRTTDDRVRMHVEPSDSAPGIAMPRAVPLKMLMRAKDWGLFRYATVEGGQAQGWVLMANVESAG